MLILICISAIIAISLPVILMGQLVPYLSETLPPEGGPVIAVTSGSIEYGRVASMAEKKQTLSILLAESAINSGSVHGVSYAIVLKPQCALTSNNGAQVEKESTKTGNMFVTADGKNHTDCGGALRAPGKDEAWGALPMLCPYLALRKNSEEAAEQGDGDRQQFSSLGSVQDGQWQWSRTEGRLDKSSGDEADEWTVTVDAPCFHGHCPAELTSNPGSKDYMLGPESKNRLFGCQLMVEVREIF